VTLKKDYRIIVLLALLVLTAGCSLLPFRKVEKGPKIRVEVRFAESAPREGYTTMKFHGAKRTVYVAPDTLFTNADLVSAVMETGDGILQAPIIILNLTDDAGTRLADITANRYNSPLAVIFNGKVMATVSDDKTNTSGRIIFSGRVTGKEAEEFVKQINSDLPPPATPQ
jgi:preprotein translocase subunit SecD